MDYISNISKNNVEISDETFFTDKSGEHFDGTSAQVFAKKTVKTKSDGLTPRKSYYVLTYNNTLYDPKGTDSHREKVLNLVLRKTTEKTYNHYIMYLKTKNNLHMTQAGRSYING